MPTPRAEYPAALLAQLLSLPDQSYSLAALAQLLRQEERHVQSRLLSLAAQGAACCRDGAWRGTGALATPVPTDQDAGLARALLLLARGDALAGGEVLLEEVRAALMESRSAAVIACLDLLIRSLRRWKHAGRSPDELRQYLALIRKVQGISIYMSKRTDEVLDLLPHARQAAQILGDRRATLILDLTEASQRHLTQLHNTERPHALLARALRDIHELGDPDILASSSHSIGILHFMEGDFPTAMAYLETGEENLFTSHFDYFQETRLRYITSAACSLGLPAKAVGVMHAAAREAALVGSQLTLKWHRAHLADDLLRMGRPDEALHVLDLVLPCVNPVTETRLWIWCMRCLAFYHFQLGRIATSHRILHHSMIQAENQGVIRPYYGFTWIFDVLWAYDQAGLPRIPGYDLEQEIKAALESPNRQFNGAALRIRALQAEARSEAPQKVADLIEQSLTHAEHVGNPLEMARCRLALSRCLRVMGRGHEADTLHDAGSAVLARYSQYDCPPPRRGAPRIPPYAPPAEEVLARLKAGLEALPAWTDLGEHLARVMHVAGDALQVERAALFNPDGAPPAAEGGIACPAAYNISRLELESEGFRPLRETIAACRRAKEPRALSVDGAGLYVPLPLPNARPWLLFLQCIYFTSHIRAQVPELWDRAASLLAQELRTALLVQEHMRNTRSAAEERARTAAAALEVSGEPYYGSSMDGILRQTDQAAATDVPMLLLGETGVGKELLARHIHAKSGRSGPFVPLHLASIPEQLFESECFGHEKGAFTDAHRQKIGLFEVAEGGTLFIDEVGEVPLALQTKLLRVLQDNCFMRVGGMRLIRSDFRLVAATNRDLARMVSEGKFREDLYYRISVVPLYLPPLRERPGDIQRLAAFFLEHFARRYQREVPNLGEQELARLNSYAWPGNIRELKSIMERAVILHTGGALHLPLMAQEPEHPTQVVAAARQQEDLLWEDLPPLEELVRRYVRHVLAVTRGRVDGKGGALAILGMKRSTLYAKIRAWALDPASQLYGSEK